MGLLDKKSLTVKVLDKRVVLPGYWEPIKDLPPEARENEYTTGYSLVSENARCAFSLTPLPLEYAMPYNDPQQTIDQIRRDMAENQGLVEVDTGRTDGGYRYIYTIVKSLLDDEDRPIPVPGYIFAMHVDYRTFTLGFSGMFEQYGMTGLRHAMGTAMISNLTGMSLGDEGWARDPYDSNVKDGYLMHLAEASMFDSLVPGDPLSILRALIRFFAENN